MGPKRGAWSRFPVAAWPATCVGLRVRFVAQWDEARKGYAIWDTVAEVWAVGYPVFGQERVAQLIADDLNAGDRHRPKSESGSGGAPLPHDCREEETPAWPARPATGPTHADLGALMGRFEGCCDEMAAHLRALAVAENHETIELALLRAAEAQAAMRHLVAELTALCEHPEPRT